MFQIAFVLIAKVEVILLPCKLIPSVDALILEHT